MRESPCRRCPFVGGKPYKSLLGCKSFCGCFHVWEEEHIKEREEIYKKRYQDYQANKFKFDGIAAGKEVGWSHRQKGNMK